MQNGQSTVSVQAQVLPGCVVEVIAHRDRVQYIITSPPEASDKSGSSQNNAYGLPGNNAFVPNAARLAASQPL